MVRDGPVLHGVDVSSGLPPAKKRRHKHGPPIRPALPDLSARERYAHAEGIVGILVRHRAVKAAH